jgi:hypothetical protein
MKSPPKRAWKSSASACFAKQNTLMSSSLRRKRVAARAKREPFAEVPDLHVVVAAALFGRKGHLVRPLPIDRSFAQFAFAIDHDTT